MLYRANIFQMYEKMYFIVRQMCSFMSLVCRCHGDILKLSCCLLDNLERMVSFIRRSR